MIEDLGGKFKTIVTPEEIKQYFLEELETLSEAERIMFSHMIKDYFNNPNEPSKIVEALELSEYKTRPVDMETFVRDPYYLGETCGELYPVLLQDLTNIFTGGYNEIILTGAIGTGKCVHASTEVFDALSGQRRRVDEEGRGIVPSLDSLSRMRYQEASFFASGTKECVELQIASGRSVILSADHPVLTPKGWCEVGTLAINDLVAIPQKIPEPKRCLKISDGEVQDVARLFSPRFNALICDDDSLAATWKLAPTAEHRRVPACFYSLNDAQVALLLNSLWLECGYIDIKQRRLVLHTLSADLITDVQYFLSRLGIQSYKDPYRDLETGVLYLYISDSKSISQFACTVGFPEQLRLDGAQLLTLLSCDEFEAVAGTLVTQYGSGDILWEPVSHLIPKGNLPVYDLSVPGTHNFVGNGILLHNTFAASIGACRVLYELSCLKDPHRFLGLAKNSNISVVALSVSESLAIKVAFEYIATKIENSPYFQEKFPFKKVKKELRFPSNVWVAARATSDNSVLGLNPIVAILDEQNFLKKPVKGAKTLPGMPNYDQAESIYNSIRRRMKSRFERRGRNPCKLFMSSSKNTFDDFTSRRVKAAKTDRSLYVLDYTPWEVRPDDFDLSKGFYVYCGNETTPSKILPDDEVEFVKANCPEGAAVVKIPRDYWNDFERDLEGSIRDIAGRSAASISHFMTRRDKIAEAFSGQTHRSHPMTSVVYDMSRPPQFNWKDMVELTEHEDRLGNKQRVLRPKLYPDLMRHVHIDPSLSGDSTGLCMAHVCGYKDVIRRNEEQREYVERAPVYYVDLMLKIIPPIGREIILADIRRLIYELSEKGYLITTVSSDSYQSADTLQQLARKGYNAQLVSVDTSINPYDTLKLAIYEGRVVGYPYAPVEKELRELEIDRKKMKVDHPVLGSKDTADALAGCVWTLSEAVSTDNLPAYMAPPSVRGDSESMFNIQTDQLVQISGTSLGDYMPFLTGSGLDPFGDMSDF